MTDNSPTGDEQAATDDASLTTATVSTYKVLGRFSASDGAGVLGQNDASSGTPIGVQGAVPNASSGYGLATPNDARIEGAIATNETDFVVEAGTDSSGDARNVVQGHADNGVASGIVGATIGGGGQGSSVGSQNQVYDDFGTVSGGYSNEAGDDDGDTRSGWLATVGGGGNNVARSFTGTVSGGEYNSVTAGSTAGAIGGGSNNQVDANHGTVAGGEDNDATAPFATVGGGTGNVAAAEGATVAGGGDTNETPPRNVVYDDFGTVGGGDGNRAGSDNDTSDDTYATVAGGESNVAAGRAASVGGGRNAEATGFATTVAGGEFTVASGTYATVGGGFGNDATARSATVAGGKDNTASDNGATVPGGNNNEATGRDSFAAGANAEAADDNAFVWADGTTDGQLAPVTFSSSSGPGPTGPDTFSARATGGVRFATGTDYDGSVTTGVKVDAGSGSWSSLSSRSVKTDVRPADTTAVLERVESLDINRWAYETSADVDHMGPMAEDFADAFDLGSDERHIATVDADGVALAAIQGLADRLADERDRLETETDRLREELAERDERIDALERENEELRDRLARVESNLGIGDGAASAAGDSATSADD